MTELRLETWTMPGAALGPANPLPPLAEAQDVHATAKIDPNIPEEDRRYFGYGHMVGCLPYQMQDGYDRHLRERPFRVAVLENEHLRAAFFLELGGRLWSLKHKASGRELLESNQVFQPANLALRNAWFCGGVEWNVGILGHCPFTCEPLFAGRLQAADGTPLLRLWEYERIRGVAFQLDAWLPAGSPVLFVRVCLRNPHRDVVPMYWWSNIAVSETPDTRILVPAAHAYRHGYDGGFNRTSIPISEGRDASYTVGQPRAMDFFFRIPDGHRPWIAALDRQGRGLVQTSTALLKGRKLFLWGAGPGGERWQNFLSPRGGGKYLEIQAGLARTQGEHLPMPAGATWTWLEAYGLLEADGTKVHGKDWATAWGEAEARLETLIPLAAVDAELARRAPTLDQSPAEVWQTASGWGALEARRRAAAGEPPLAPASIPFAESTLGPAQAPWLALLDRGELPPAEGEDTPTGYLVAPVWRERLEGALKRRRGSHWAAWLHLGVMRFAAGDHAGAKRAWERSLKHRRTAWALRNLAVVAGHRKQHAAAADLLAEAQALRPDLLPLAVEWARALLRAGRAKDLLAHRDALPPAVRDAGRMRMLCGQAALKEGRLAEVEALLRENIVIADMREGEVSLSDLWFGLHEQRLSAQLGQPVDDALRERVRREFPPPAAIDFRMRT